MKSAYSQKNNIQKPALYSVVFDVVAVRYVALLMFIFFVMQPVAPAFASEDTSEETPETQKTEIIEPKPEIVIEPDVITQGITEESEQEGVLEINETPEQLASLGNQTVEDIDVPTVQEGVLEGETLGDAIMETSDTQTEESLSEENIQDPENSESAEIGSGTENEEESPEVFEDNSTSTTEVEDVQGEITDTDLEDLSKLLATTTEEVEMEENQDENQSSDDGSSSDTQSSTQDDDSLPDQESDTSTTENSQSSSDNNPNDNSEIPTDEEVVDEITVATSSKLSTSEIENMIEETASTSSTTDSLAEDIQELPSINVTNNNLNAYQFTNKECIAVGDGSFYCSEQEEAPAYIEDRVYAAPDSDGDMEIFATIGGKTTQITNNLVDDSSPYYDGLSNTIVWQSKQNDRFQIAQYDVETGDVVYITDASYNNMEPTAYDTMVMWQAWIGSNWEVMLFDSKSNELVQLTDNEMHDITPQMRDGYIMWQTQFAEGWKVALYDQKVKRVKYIADSDGSKVANPRFVLVYDSTDKVGDVRTLGYDFGSGSSFTLGSLPAEMPEDIPQPDQTGETRALIQAKPLTREGEAEDVEPVPTGPTPTPSASSTDLTSINATSTLTVEAGDLIVEPIVSQATSTENVSAQALSIEDIVDSLVAESLSSTKEDVSHIDDVVIPPFMSTTTDEVG